jgi:redox-sensitive bicupin YhaK (pirin superfamily)
VGLLEAGDVQGVIVGSGVIHIEVLRQGKGLMWGFQLWVNLSAALKKVFI